MTLFLEARKTVDMKEIHFKNLNDLDSEYWWNRVRFSFVRRNILRHAFTSGSTLLDIGCGTGSFLSWLKRDPSFPDYNLIGVDASRQACDYANSKNVRALLYDFSVPLTELIKEKPALITMLDVLEHIPNSVDVLKNIRETAGQGAKLIVLVPAFDFLWSSWDDELGHCRRYTKRILLNELCEAGWRPIACQYLFIAMFIPALLRKMLINAGILSPVEFPNTSQWVNNLLIKYFCMENRVGFALPFGTSIGCIATND